MKRRTMEKIFVFILTLAMGLTSVTWPEVSKKASAAATIDDADYTITSIALPEEEVTIPSDQNGGHELLQRITGNEIHEATGIEADDMIVKSVNVYVQITKCSPYSRLKISGGNIVSGNYSNKELVGVKCTTSTNTNYKLHNGYRTEKQGTGAGAAGTGIYVFPECNTTKAASLDELGIVMRRMTTDVDGYIIGIVFKTSGKSVSVSKPDGDGKVTLTEGFDPNSVTLESKEQDNTDISDEELGEAEKEAQEKAEKERIAARNGLKSSIDAANAFSAEDYEENSLAAVKAAIPAAQAAYDKENDTKGNYRAAREALDNVRAKLIPKMATETGNPKDFRFLTKKEVVKEMGAGINLGNTMDGGTYPDPSETSWQAYKTTKAYIKALHDAGYNTVRVPVTWGSFIHEDYSINQAWINRVQEIVDYCVDQDMYCIINIHHDGIANHDERGDNPGAWLNTAADDIESVYAKFAGTWKTIAGHFKDYDEHLIFESMNEVTDAHNVGSGHVAEKNEDADVLQNLNQIFINTVRATGSNNTKRWLAITGRFATTNGITAMPEDALADDGDVDTTRLMFSVHIYKNNSAVRWTYNNLKEWQSSLSSSAKAVKALDATMPLYIGEYGVRTQAQQGSATGYNNAERALNYEACADMCDLYGAVPIVWDQGTGNYLTVEKETGLFTDWDRPDLKPVYDDVVYGTIRGTYNPRTAEGEAGPRMIAIYKSYGHSDENDNGISVDPEIHPITDITLDEERVQMKAGEHKTLTVSVAPEDTNDVLLWSTDDDAIVTVSQGHLHAKGIGVTYVHAYSQSRSVTKDIKVVVSPSGNETATAIQTEKAYYQLELGSQTTIQTTLTPANSKDAVSYTSSHPEVATVNSSGVVTAESVGNTYIIVSAASGVSTIVNISVIGTGNYIDIALHTIMGNVTDKGQSIRLQEDGQYTLTYDIANDLSDAGKAAGITELKDITSVYIRDLNTLKPLVKSAQIRYDKIVVNDTELTITNHDFKEAVKASGQFDTNDPITAWDGSVVEEVTTNESDHTASFVGIDHPTKISVTFTIQNLQFHPTSEKQKEAKGMAAVGGNKIKLSGIGETADLSVTLTPAETDSYVTFYSTDSSVAAVDNAAKGVDENGNVSVTVTGLSEGVATVTAITENGLKVFFAVGVGNVDVPDPTDPTPDGLDGSTPEATPAPGGNATPAPGDSKTPVSEGPKATSGPGRNKTPAPGSHSIKAKKVTLKKVKSTKKKTILVRWKKVSGVTGYEIQISANKKFKKGIKKYIVKKAKTTKKTIKKLKSKKKYYVRVRAYKKVSGGKDTGKWSKVKKVKVK